MKKKYLFVAPCLIFSILLTHRVNAQFNYINPVPGSNWQLPQTTIILRNGDLIDESTIHNKNFIEITGSSSGNHDWSAILSEGKTVMVKPDVVFNYGETVKVTIHSTLRKKDGSLINGTSFSFQIRNAITPEEKQQYEQSDRELNMEALGYDSNHQSAHPRTDNLDSMPTFTITINKNAAPGQIFFDSQSDNETDTNSFPSIINNDGSIVWTKDAGPSGHDFKINYNGYLTYYDYVYNGWKVMDSNYNAIDSFQSIGYPTNAHDMLMYPDKHIFVMGTDNRTIDMSQIVPGGQPNATVKGLVVQEFDSNKNVIFEWNSFDHFQITDADSNTSLNNLIVDYEHPNAFERDNDGNLLISSRNFCEITKISLTTGDIIWRLGGENNQFTFVNDSIRFSYQHDIRRIANGDITLFNNGNYLPTQKSSAKEYSLDEVNKVATLVWSYDHKKVDSTHVFAYAEGSVQRLSNGNTMICWGNVRDGKGIPNMTEVDSSNKITWEFAFDSSLEESYRAHKYEWNPCSRITGYTMTALPKSTKVKLEWGPSTGAAKYHVQYRVAGTEKWTSAGNTTKTQIRKDGLTPSTKYEWHVQTRCTDGDKSNYSPISTFTTKSAKEENLLDEESNSLSVEIYPNPASDVLTLSMKGLNGGDPIFVFIRNMPGQIVYRQQTVANDADMSLNVDVHALQKGFYVLEIHRSAQRVMEKFIKQ